MDGIRVSFLRQTVDVRAARIGIAHHTGDLIEGFSGRIIARLSQKLEGVVILHDNDHRVAAGDDKRKLFLHASPKPSEYDTDVPLLIWTSPAYDRQNPAVVGNLRRNRHKGVESNASVFPTMLSMAGIKTKARVDSLSLTNPAYRLGVRYYLNDHNHGVPLSAWGIK